MMTAEEFIQKSGAEVVADNLIVGITDTRRVVGSVAEGKFTLNEAGQELLAELEGKPVVKAAESDEVEPKKTKK